jgi:hypothetical protein
VFDAGGLQSITKIQATNATVQVGDPSASYSYLKFVPGQTGPLAVTATRIDESLPMSWAFDAKDTVNVTHCQGVSPPGPPGPSWLSINDISVDEGNSGVTSATFTVTRSGSTSGSTTVSYKTSGGTATAGTDYTAVALTSLTFAAGETSKTVSVNVTGDTLPEANETFNVVLSSPTGAVISDTSGTATILNDDGAAYLAVNDVVANEGNSGTTPFTFTITRSGNTNGSSTVKYSTSDGTATAGTDYTAVPLTSVTFAPGETTKAVTVNVTGDTTAEPDEGFSVVLSAPVGAAISDTTATATIRNDE